METDLNLLLAEVQAEQAADPVAFEARYGSPPPPVPTATAPPCHRCFGTGVLEAFRHIDSGTCWACFGRKH